MIRIFAAPAPWGRRSGRIATSLWAAALLASSACSEGATKLLSPTPGPAVDAAVGQMSTTADSDKPGVAVGPMTNGGNHTGSITAAGQTDQWTFSATQGQFLVIAVGELTGVADFTPWIRLKDPNGVIIGNTWNTTAAQFQVSAPLTGTYTVLVATNDPGLDATGTYTLTAAQLQGNFIVSPGDEGGAMTNGANHTGAISIGDLDFYSINATAGEAIIVGLGEVSGTADFTPWIRLITPAGALLANVSNVAAAQTQVAASTTGTYTVIVSTNDAGNDATGTYSLTLARSGGAITISPGDQGGPMTNGVNHSGTIPVGDFDAWTFSATQGELLVLAVGEVTGSANFTPWIRLIAPNGATIGNNWNTAAAQIAVNATLTGTYLVVIGTNDAGNDDTGDYLLTLSKGSTPPTISPGDQGGPMVNGANHTGTIGIGDLDVFTFTANQGEGIIVAVGEVSGTADFTPWVRLVGPTGTLVGSSSNVAAAQIAINAASTGTFQVIITTNDAGNDATGDYTLTLAKGPGTFTISPGDQGGAATNGGNNLGTIHVGDLDVYTFNTNAGLPFAVSIGETSGSASFTPWIRVLSPNGAFMGNTWNTTAAQFSAIAPLTGQYTVIISTNDAGNDDTGDYRLVVQKSGAFVTPPGDEGGTMTNGAVHTGTIVIGDLDRWTVAANQGETIAVSVGKLTGPDFSPWIRLVSPSGVVVGNASNTTVAQLTINALETGNYTVAVGTNDAGNDGTGDYTITVAKAPGTFVVSPGDQGGSASNGVKNGTIVVGDLDMWSVTANQGSPIMMTVTKVSGTTDYTPWIRLVAPNGTIIGNNWGATSGTVNIAAPSTGTYTVILGTNDAGNDATGTYTLSIAGVNLVPRPLMTPVVGLLDAGMSLKPTSYGPPPRTR